METIRILFYTDIAELDVKDSEKGVSDLKGFIEFKLKSIAKVDIQIRNRNWDYVHDMESRTATRITCGLLEGFDEVWFFGFDQSNDPEHMLSGSEVTALREWMKWGGVMVTGDHSQFTAEVSACPAGVGHEKFRALGFTIGSTVPRAGQLRVWSGPPTNCRPKSGNPQDSDTYNTQVSGPCHEDLNEDCLQGDPNPQCLEASPHPPHFLFTYKFNERDEPVPITHFPDHAHVGLVIDNPDPFDDDWPPRPPSPQVVAKGRDNRFAEPRVYNLVVAYDGDAAEVGRIVSDASFHHFLNMNLESIRGRDALNNPLPDTPLDEIAQFHANLALWLAPRHLRARIRQRLFFEAAKHLNVYEAIGNGHHELGRVARRAVKAKLGTSNLYRILEGGGSEQEKLLAGEEDVLTYLFTGQGDPNKFYQLSPEELLGRGIEAYYGHLRESRLNPLMMTKDIVPPEVTFGALRNALAARADALAAQASPETSETPGFSADASEEESGEEEEGGGN